MWILCCGARQAAERGAGNGAAQAMNHSSSTQVQQSPPHQAVQAAGAAPENVATSADVSGACSSAAVPAQLEAGPQTTDARLAPASRSMPASASAPADLQSGTCQGAATASSTQQQELQLPPATSLQAACPPPIPFGLNALQAARSSCGSNGSGRSRLSQPSPLVPQQQQQQQQLASTGVVQGSQPSADQTWSAVAAEAVAAAVGGLPPLSASQPTGAPSSAPTGQTLVPAAAAHPQPGQPLYQQQPVQLQLHLHVQLHMPDEEAQSAQQQGAALQAVQVVPMLTAVDAGQNMAACVLPAPSPGSSSTAAVAGAAGTAMVLPSTCSAPFLPAPSPRSASNSDPASSLTTDALQYCKYPQISSTVPQVPTQAYPQYPLINRSGAHAMLAMRSATYSNSGLGAGQLQSPKVGLPSSLNALSQHEHHSAPLTSPVAQPVTASQPTLQSSPAAAADPSLGSSMLSVLDNLLASPILATDRPGLPKQAGAQSDMHAPGAAAQPAPQGAAGTSAGSPPPPVIRFGVGEPPAMTVIGPRAPAAPAAAAAPTCTRRPSHPGLRGKLTVAIYEPSDLELTLSELGPTATLPPLSPGAAPSAAAVAPAGGAGAAPGLSRGGSGVRRDLASPGMHPPMLAGPPFSAGVSPREFSGRSGTSVISTGAGGTVVYSTKASPVGWNNPPTILYGMASPNSPGPVYRSAFASSGRGYDAGSTPTMTNYPSQPTTMTTTATTVTTAATADLALLEEAVSMAASMASQGQHLGQKAVNVVSPTHASSLLKVDGREWAVGALLGVGRRSQVYAGLDRATGKQAAIKVVSIDAGSSSASTNEAKGSAIEQELSHYRSLSHRHVVEYIGCSMQRRGPRHKLQVILEHVSGGSVARMLAEFGALSENVARLYCNQILSGLQYLHSNKISHRCLSGANCLVTLEGVVKLADFGALGASSLNPELWSGPGAKNWADASVCALGLDSLDRSVFWMPPEVVQGKGQGRRGDIWRLGCTVIEMLTASHPWPGLANEAHPWGALLKIATTPGGPPRPPGISDEALDFLDQCLKPNPSERPTAAQLRQHKWLASMPPSPTPAAAIAAAAIAGDAAGGGKGGGGSGSGGSGSLKK